MNKNIPKASYGVLEQTLIKNSSQLVAEEIKIKGYSVINSKFTKKEIHAIADSFDLTREKYYKIHKVNFLTKIGENNTIRLPIALDQKYFLKVLTNKHLHEVLKNLMRGSYILNQQNGIINPAKKTYNQSYWHRDIPYQHFISSRPLAVNALYCVDDFTMENGATFLLPSSHKSESLPSNKFILNNAIQIEAKAGSFILLDCMLYHAGGLNKTLINRRAINHVFTIPYFKQQINIAKSIKKELIPKRYQSLLGYNLQDIEDIESYLSNKNSQLKNE